MKIFRINNSIFNNYVTENNNDLYYCYMIRFNLKFINCFFFHVIIDYVGRLRAEIK